MRRPLYFCCLHLSTDCLQSTMIRPLYCYFVYV
uniref:Uncharacterized protein n=1 Tax=Myoviridae sp. ctCdG12 TaxID=2825052 RepID=A0A8S5U2N4_9CAUD|nr:MAG TPA: hypothetical protein [Myoviridae sp. ctCdG12]